MNLKVLELEINEYVDTNTLFDHNGNLKFAKNDTIQYISKKAKKEKRNVYRTEAITEAINHFKKKGNDKKISRGFQSRYIYNFTDLCQIIDTLTNLNMVHNVWFKPIPDFDVGFEINFEELL